MYVKGVPYRILKDVAARIDVQLVLRAPTGSGIPVVLKAGEESPWRSTRGYACPHAYNAFIRGVYMAVPDAKIVTRYASYESHKDVEASEEEVLAATAVYFECQHQQELTSGA